MGDNDAAIGELKGLYRGLEKTVDKLEQDVNSVFDLMRKGFSHSQSDREALGKALGEKIDAIAAKQTAEIAAIAKVMNKAQGATSTYSRLIDIGVMLCGGCLGSVVLHIFH